MDRNPGPPLVAGVLLGHGQFAQGLYSALRLIVGEVPDFEVVSTEGKARADLERIVAEARQRFGPLIVFTDMYGGGCANICGSLLRNCSDASIICGVNLPMLIKFVQYRATTPFPEFCGLLVQAGRDGVRGLEGSRKYEL